MADQRRIVNTYDQIVAAGGGYAIIRAYSVGRRTYCDGWAVARYGAGGEVYATAKHAPWYDHSRITFRHFSYGNDRTASLAAAQAWVQAHGGPTEWARNRMGDYVARDVQKRFPIPRAPRQVKA